MGFITKDCMVMSTGHNLLCEEVENTQHATDTPQELGKKSEILVSYWLRNTWGIRAKLQDYYEHFDLDCSGVHVEVKSATRQEANKKSIWRFNIHRHGVLNEDGIDFYVLRLERVPEFSYAIHLLIPSPISTPTIAISMRSLLTRYAKYFNNIEPLRLAIAAKEVTA